MGQIPVPIMLATALILFLGIGIHEYAHCKFADMAGDPTPAYYGRVTLNLTKHFELSGVIMMIFTTLTGFGVGWGKPAPVNPDKMKNPRVDWFISVAAGPVSNIAQALIYALILRVALRGQWFPYISDFNLHVFLGYLLFGGVLINLALACFNLIPFGPLDGHWLVGLLLPEKPRYYWFKFNRQIGMFGLFGAVMILQATHISLTAGPVSYLFNLFVGTSIRSAQDQVFGPLAG